MLYMITHTYRELFQRGILDKYLARALSLPLSAVTEEIFSFDQKMMNESRFKNMKVNKTLKTKTQYKRLKIIDESNYVMTLDYALKMINIHERKECGMPVIIEGETGVGKTELLKMLSKFWNFTFEVQLKEQKDLVLKEITSLKESKFNQLKL